MKKEYSEKNLLMQIANGFRASRGIRKNLDGEALVELANQNKFPQIIDRTITKITAEDLGGITEIGDYGLACCTDLQSIIIPTNIKRIGYSAFYTCPSLKNVYYNGDIASWCNIIFVSPMSNPATYARKIYIKNSETKEYELLTNLVIPDSVTEIKNYAFDFCQSLKSITIPNSITSIGRCAFALCIELTSVTIPDSVRSIGIDAFSGCYRLTSLTIGRGVKSIGNTALHIGKPDNRSTITFLATEPPSITTSTFSTLELKKIIVPAGCGEAYKTATNWAKYADYIEEAAE